MVDRMSITTEARARRKDSQFATVVCEISGVSVVEEAGASAPSSSYTANDNSL